MSKFTFLGRVMAIVAGVLATCTVGPIFGFNVYFNAFKNQFHLEATEGKFPLYVYDNICNDLLKMLSKFY